MQHNHQMSARRTSYHYQIQLRDETGNPYLGLRINKLETLSLLVASQY